MSADTRWIVGTVVVVALGVLGVLSVQIGSLRADVRNVEERLAAVEAAVAVLAYRQDVEGGDD